MSNNKKNEVTIKRARVKAKQLAELVQGTSALEVQGLDNEGFKIIEDKIFNMLIDGLNLESGVIKLI